MSLCMLVYVLHVHTSLYRGDHPETILFQIGDFSWFNDMPSSPPSVKRGPQVLHPTSAHEITIRTHPDRNWEQHVYGWWCPPLIMAIDGWTIPHFSVCLTNPICKTAQESFGDFLAAIVVLDSSGHSWRVSHFLYPRTSHDFFPWLAMSNRF